MSEKDALEAEAAKRNRTKGRSLSHMEWRVEHDSVRGWHLAFVETALSLHSKAEAEQSAFADAFRDGRATMDDLHRAAEARLRAAAASFRERRP